MNLDQEDDMLPPGEQHLELPVRSYMEAFKPLVPAGGGTIGERLQHIFVTNGSPATFAHVVSKQWRADRVNGRSTWAVLGTEFEASQLGYDLIDGNATDVPGQRIDSPLVKIALRDEPLSGSGLVILTFERLVRALSTCWQPDGTWLWDDQFGSPTVVMNFAWGNMSFEMAFACPLLASLIGYTTETGPQVVMACTVSSDNQQYFGREWHHVQMQEIASLDKAPSRALIFRGPGARNGRERNTSLQEIETLLFDISDVGGRPDRQRTLLVADLKTVRMLPEASRPLSALLKEQLRAGHTENIALDSRVTYVGQVSNIADVVIFPYAEGSMNDMGQIVCGADECGMERSQAEINYHSRFNQESDAQLRIHLLSSEDQFRRLPAHCETSAAHTLHLARLLVCCKLIWPNLPLSEVPVLFPTDEDAVVQQVRHLIAKGIVAKPSELSGQESQSTMGAKPELYGMINLTRLGRMTAKILMRGVQSFHSAHLLAQLLETKKDDTALDPDSFDVVEATLALSVLTELNKNGATFLNRVTFMERSRPEHKPWYEQNLGEISARKFGRGPIWLAAGLWQKMMENYRWRGPLEFHDELGVRFSGMVLNDGRISLNREASLNWDRRLEALSSIVTSLSDLSPVTELNDTSLDAEEFFAAEIALVKAFMDRIMVVEDHGWDFEAWDMASGHKLDRPFDSQDAQIWWWDCFCHDSLRNGSRTERPLVFCIYSYLAYKLSADGRTLSRKAVDATVVSAKAVQLAFEGIDDSHLPLRTRQRYIPRLKQGSPSVG